MLQQAKKKENQKEGVIMHSLRNLSEEVMGVAAVLFGFGESRAGSIVGCPWGNLQKQKLKVREKYR